MELRNESYAEAEKIGKEFYKTIRRIWCPALNDYVSFEKDGFRHLIGKGNVLRPKSERKRRFYLLRHIPSILMNPKANHSHEARSINGKYAHYWIFTEIIDGMHIKIVIRQTPNGRKRFLSVYSKKQKSTP